ncbi:MAG: histidine phosphatase family protein [Desulfobacteraceae bacterium]|nr:MAG: histidine phosphatase family protein [Desulfobacteraceae bacterium]
MHPSIPLLVEAGHIKMDLGELDGMEAQNWAEQYPDYCTICQDAPASLKMLGGEHLEEFQSRSVDALNRITQIYPPKGTLLISSHNFVTLTINFWLLHQVCN